MPLPSERNLPAFLLSLGLHAALVVSLSLAGRSPTSATRALPNSVAMPGNAIEIEAPTPELAHAPGAAEPQAATAPAPSPAPTPASPNTAPPDPVDISALPIAPLEPAKPVEPAEPRSAPRASPPREQRPRPAAKPRASALGESASASARPGSAPAVSATAGSEAPTSGAPAAGTFGQEGLAPGVRRLGYAFTRAIPAATPADPSWRELPVGHVGTIRIELEVDADNHLGALKRWQARPGEPAPPPALERMVERTLVLLRAGQFALSGSNQAGSERLTIDVTLRDETADDDASADVVQKKFDGASPGHPGKAYFRYGTGRAFEAKVTIVSSGK